jgi:histone-lysine N-methyltransferase MLL3
MCLSCGSFVKGEEGRIISCCQCGHCYHTYCAGVNKVCIFFSSNIKTLFIKMYFYKLSKVILEKGWRYLDCTVCEGCGKATDVGRLLLCDDCDRSYHLYC